MLVQQLRPVQSSVQNLPGGAESGVGSNLGAAAGLCCSAAVLLDCATAAAVLLLLGCAPAQIMEPSQPNAISI